MMLHESALVFVEIGRAEPFAGNSAAIHELEFPFRRLDRLLRLGVQLLRASAKRESQRVFLREKYIFEQQGPVQRSVFARQPDGMALRAVEDQLRQIKQGVRARRLLDRVEHRRERLLVRYE